MSHHSDDSHEPGVPDEEGRRAEEGFRHLRNHLAAVRAGAPSAHAALKLDAVGRPRVDVDVQTVPVLTVCFPVLLRQRREVVLETELRRHHVVVASDDVATLGQARIGGHDDAERRVVGRVDRAVVHHGEVAVDATEVADLERYPRQHFVRHRRAEVPWYGRTPQPSVRSGS